MDKPLFNTKFADSRGISKDDQEAMQKIYGFLHAILARPAMHCSTPAEAVEVIQSLETTLQLFWQFPLDKAFHNYWVDLRGCTCPKMDNRDMAGSGKFVLTQDCPYHGNDKAETWEDRRLR